MKTDLLVTTCHPGLIKAVWERYKEVRKGGTAVTVVITSIEAKIYGDTVVELRNSGYAVDELPISAEKAERESDIAKRLPVVEDIFRYMAEESEYEYNCFINSDIEISHIDLQKLIRLSKTVNKVVAVYRKDRRGGKTIGTYYHGIDMVICNKAQAKSIAKIFEGWPELKIGVPGWDYWLAMMSPKDGIVFVDKIPIFHEVHDSGCGLLWEDNMILIGVGENVRIRKLAREVLGWSRRLPRPLGYVKYLIAKAVFYTLVAPRMERKGWRIGRHPYRLKSGVDSRMEGNP